jgi:hypothetical protein
VDVEIVATDPEVSWNVFIDNQKLCTSPCTQRIKAKGALHLREESGILSRTSKVLVTDLSKWEDFGGVRVEADTASSYSLSGLVRIGGIFYGAIGLGFGISCYATDRDSSAGATSCLMSGVTTVLGAALFAAGTWIMDTEGDAKMMPR